MLDFAGVDACDWSKLELKVAFRAIVVDWSLSATLGGCGQDGSSRGFAFLGEHAAGEDGEEGFGARDRGCDDDRVGCDDG